MELAKYFNCFDLTTVNPTTPKIFSEISKNSRESSQKVRRLDSIKQKSDYPYSETKSIANRKATKSINVGDYDGVSSVNQSIATNSISGAQDDKRLATSIPKVGNRRISPTNFKPNIVKICFREKRKLKRLSGTQELFNQSPRSIVKTGMGSRLK